MSNLIEHYSTNKNISYEKQWGHVHFIGFSLGAHVVGHAGDLLKKDGFEIYRITGLDPAEPCFEKVGKAPLRLSSESGKFVDVIHSSVATRKNSAFGLLEPIGNHFYTVYTKLQLV